MKKKFTIIVLIAILGMSGLIKAQTFSEQSVGLNAVNYGNQECVQFVDYNNDGFLDLFYTGSTNTSGSVGLTELFKNNGDNTFTNVSGLPFADFFAQEAEFADYNNDGYIDLALTAEGAGSPGGGGTTIYKNNGDDTFTNIFHVDLGGPILWYDYDLNGSLDLMLGVGFNYSAPFELNVYKNNGNNTFTQDATILFPNVNLYNKIYSFDYDNNGIQDLFLRVKNTSDVWEDKLYKNNGDKTFTVINEYNIPVTGSRSYTFTDYNNDGYVDIYNNNNNVYVNNSGTGSFSTIALNTVTALNGGNEWGDYDNDGDPDLLIEGTDQGYVFRNDGSNNFTNISASLPGIAQWSSVKWGDYNNDGFLDFLLAGYLGSSPYMVTKLYKSSAVGIANTNPSPPTNLSHTIDGSQVTFNWDVGNDIETDNNSLTYNIYIGTAPGAIDIISPNSDISTGFRRIPVNGNTGSSLSYVLDSLEPGNYYWSVQSIDQAYSGSDFATEQTFYYEICSDTTINDTTTHYVSNPEFEAISPSVYLDSTENLLTTVGSCDSIVNHYTKFIFDANICTETITEYEYISVTDTLIIDVTITEVSPPDNTNTIKVYPNPANDFVIINTGDYSDMDTYNLIIENSLGQIVFENLINEAEFQINVNDFGDYGTFFIKIYDSGSTLIDTRKIILQ